MTYAQAKEAQKPKRNPRWRELTDEQRWERIYRDREKRATQVIKSMQEAVALALPAYAMHMAICEVHHKDSGVIRYDAHRAVVGAIALVSARLRKEQRDDFANKLDHYFRLMKSSGFYTDEKEFLYAVSCALVKMADSYHYPADAPATMAALLFKEDAEDDGEGNAWGLSKEHAIRMGGLLYDTFLATEFYAQPMG
jgi:hypothetical protein